MVPVIYVLSCLSSANCLRAFLCIIFKSNLMQCVVFGLSTDRLTPHPFNLCSNAGSTHMSFPNTTSKYDIEQMHSISLVDHGEACSEWNLSCYTAVWSWPPCCSSVSGSWHILCRSTSLCRATIFFSDPQRVFAMKCHVELPETSMRE